MNRHSTWANLLVQFGAEYDVALAETSSTPTSAAPISSAKILNTNGCDGVSVMVRRSSDTFRMALAGLVMDTLPVPRAGGELKEMRADGEETGTGSALTKVRNPEYARSS